MRLLMGVCVAMVLFCSAAAQDGEDVVPGDDREAFEELMKILDEETTVATKTRLNSDYVPGMVTVLQGEDLEALGITTVWEALSLVPGLETYRSGLGEPFVTVRGLPFPFNSGNIKVLVNSIAMSRETSSVNTSALLLPVEQVERVEVIRGPGSSVYGNFAFLGLVNIITQKDDNGAFVSVTGGDRYAAGVQVFAGDGDVRFNANVAGWTTEEGEGPVDTQGEEDRLNAVASLEYRNTSVSYQMFDRTYVSNRSAEERNQAVALKHHRAFSGNWYVDIDANYLNTDSDATNVIFKGDLVQGEMDLGWAGERMNWLFALSGTSAHIDRAILDVPGRLEDAADVTDTGWEAYGVSVQGQFELTEDVSVTGGLRFDSRVDLDAEHLTPRLAFVGRVGERHLVKAQYSEGFRAPTFFEVFGLSQQGNFGLDFETIGTSEMSYVFRDPLRTARVTLFYSRVKNMIYPFGMGLPPAPKQAPAQPPPPLLAGFRNVARGKSGGVELEWEQQLGDPFRWGANLSYVYSRDTRNTNVEEMRPEGMTHWLGNVNFIVRAARNLLFAGHLYYVGDRFARGGDVEGYYRLNLSLSAFHLGARGLTLRASVKNVLNDRIRYMLILPTGPLVDTHDNRTWWLRLAYQL